MRSQIVTKAVFPAHAGMSLEPPIIDLIPFRFPRSRGDEPLPTEMPAHFN